jgi:pimeloyl-ACP methyl ester carboxylesterase
MRKNSAIIFIPGYKGSLLKRDNKVVWANWLSLFTFNKLNLDYSKYPILHPESVLERVSFTRKIYKNVYYSFIKNLGNELPRYKLCHFAYDWRLSINKNVEKLANYINDLRSKGIQEFNFIGHSLGGLIIYYLLRESILINNEFNKYCTSDFNNIFLVGVPFRGTIKGFRDLHLGERVYINRHLLSNKTVRTFPVMYQVFPYERDSIIEVNSKQYVDIYNYNNWQNYNFAGLNNLSLSEQYTIKKNVRGWKRYYTKYL